MDAQKPHLSPGDPPVEPTQRGVDSKARRLLAEVKTAQGFVPNLHRALAGSDALLQGFTALEAAIRKTSLPVRERLLAQLIIARHVGAGYCQAARQASAHASGLAWEQVESLANDQPLPDARDAALQAFVGECLRTQGEVGPGAWTDFEHAGFTRKHALEVLLLIGAETLCGLASRMTGPSIDWPYRAQPAGP